VSARLVDVFVQQRTARVERPLTYAVPSEMDLGIGDVVRVPLGPRELYGYVVSSPREAAARNGVREIAAMVGAPRAFDAAALALARWIAARYCCSLGEALGPFVFAAAVPRVVDRFELLLPLEPEAFPTLPPRLIALLRDDFADGFSLETVLRHPEARRSGDRRTLLGALSALQRAGALGRRRTFVAPYIAEAREKVLAPAGKDVRGPRVRALVELVAAEGSLRRRDAALAGFSQAIVARAIREGALLETSERAAYTRASGAAEDQNFTATREQAAAIGAIVARLEAGAFSEILLQGITGSGKTFVYLRAIVRAL